jgi:S1-C subfamily serine protease
LVAVLLGLSVPLPAAGQSVPEELKNLQTYRRQLFDRVAPSVVFIARKDSLGSGFFVDHEGLILTNAHVVGEREKVKVILHDGRKLTGTVVEQASEDYDLALVRVDIEESMPLKLGGFEGVRVGNWAACVGHGMGGAWTFTTGMISNIYPVEEERPVFQTQIPLNPGSSGGPVLDAQGRVVGVVSSGIEGSNNINFAIQIDIAFEHLDGLESPNQTCVTVKAPKGVPVFVNDRMRGKGPEVEVCLGAGEYEVFAVVDGQMRRETISVPETQEVELVD